MKLQDLKKEIKYNVIQDFPNKGVKFIDFTPAFSSSVIMNEIAEYIGNYRYDNKLCDKIDYIIMPQSRGYIIGSFLSFSRKKRPTPVKYWSCSNWKDWANGSEAFSLTVSVHTVLLVVRSRPLAV